MKKTIAFVYHSLDIGGAEKELLAYISNLNFQKYDIHLLLTRIDGELLQDLPSGVTLHHVPGDSVKPDIKYLINLHRTLGKIKPDIVIGFMQDISLCILIIKTLARHRYICIVSEQIVLSEWQRVDNTNWLKRVLVKIFYPSSNALFVQSESIANDLITNFHINPRKIFFIPSYIKTDKNGHSLHVRFPFFLYVGRLVPSKNIELLLLAFKKLLKISKTTHLIFVGPTNLYYETMTKKLNIEDRVRFVGYTRDTTPYYQKATALIIPSLVEGRSRVMLEAMLHNCVVISSNFIGHERYIEDNVSGLTFDRHSVDDLVKVCTHALKEPHRMNAIKIRAKKKALRHVSRQTRSFNNILNNSLISLIDVGKRDHD